MERINETCLATDYSVAITPLFGKLRIHISDYVDHEDLYIMPLKGYDVLLRIPWFHGTRAILDAYDKKIALTSKGRNNVLDVNSRDSQLLFLQKRRERSKGLM